MKEKKRNFKEFKPTQKGFQTMDMSFHPTQNAMQYTPFPGQTHKQSPTS